MYKHALITNATLWIYNSLFPFAVGENKVILCYQGRGNSKPSEVCMYMYVLTSYRLKRLCFNVHYNYVCK